MPRGRKLSIKQIERAAIDRRNGMSWSKLSKKYKVVINTMRFTLAEYSDEFAPNPRPSHPPEQKTGLAEVQMEVEKIKKALKKRFNLHV